VERVEPSRLGVGEGVVEGVGEGVVEGVEPSRPGVAPAFPGVT
jgi:hypothetical protein